MFGEVKLMGTGISVLKVKMRGFCKHFIAFISCNREDSVVYYTNESELIKFIGNICPEEPQREQRYDSASYKNDYMSEVLEVFENMVGLIAMTPQVGSVGRELAGF